MKKTSIKNQREAEIKVAELRSQLFALQLKKETTGLEKPAELRKIKKEITKLLFKAKI